MKKDMRLVQCTVNGRQVAEYVDVRESLLDMLFDIVVQYCVAFPGAGQSDNGR